MIQYKHEVIPYEKRNKHPVDEDEKAVAEHVSNFLLTMSTNQTMDDDEAEAFAGPLNEMATILFTTEAHMKEIIQFKTYEDGELWEDPETTYGSDTIISVDSKSKVEVGHFKKGSRLHLHVALKIWHRSYISLKREELLLACNEILSSLGFDFPIVYLNIKANRPTAEDYLRVQTAHK